jgi:hypothetical protein
VNPEYTMTSRTRNSEARTHEEPGVKELPSNFDEKIRAPLDVASTSLLLIMDLQVSTVIFVY